MKQFSGIIFFALLILLPSCRVLYPNLMFQQRQYQYFELAQKQIDQYVIQAGDEISLSTYARDGFRLIDIIGGSASGVGVTNGGMAYLVDNEGFVRLPVLGELFVKGYTEKELARIIADKLSGLFVDPFVILKVTNKRAFLFRGASGGIIGLAWWRGRHPDCCVQSRPDPGPKAGNPPRHETGNARRTWRRPWKRRRACRR